MNTIRTISDVLRDKADETKKGITFVENRRDVFVPYGRVHAEAVAGPVDVDRVRTLSDMMPGAPILVDERSHTLLTGANGARTHRKPRNTAESRVAGAGVVPDFACGWGCV